MIGVYKTEYLCGCYVRWEIVNKISFMNDWGKYVWYRYFDDDLYLRSSIYRVVLIFIMSKNQEIILFPVGTVSFTIVYFFLAVATISFWC
jgi:hypothetical protein